MLHVQPEELVKVGEDRLVAGGSIGGTEDGDHFKALTDKVVAGVKVSCGVTEDCRVDGGAESESKLRLERLRRPFVGICSVLVSWGAMWRFLGGSWVVFRFGGVVGKEHQAFRCRQIHGGAVVQGWRCDFLGESWLCYNFS